MTERSPPTARLRTRLAGVGERIRTLTRSVGQGSRRRPRLRAASRQQRRADTVEKHLRAVVQHPAGQPDIDPAEFGQLGVSLDVPRPLLGIGTLSPASGRCPQSMRAITNPYSSSTGICGCGRGKPASTNSKRVSDSYGDSAPPSTKSSGAVAAGLAHRGVGRSLPRCR